VRIWACYSNAPSASGIFEEDVSIHVSRIFAGHNDHVFLCIQGEAAAIDTILDHKDDFLENMDYHELISFFSYAALRDAMFANWPLPLAREDDGLSYEVVLSCLHGLPVKSEGHRVARSFTGAEVAELARNWLRREQGDLNILVWDSADSVFRKIEKAKSMNEFWKFGSLALGTVFGASCSLRALRALHTEISLFLALVSDRFGADRHVKFAVATTVSPPQGPSNSSC